MKKTVKMFCSVAIPLLILAGGLSCRIIKKIAFKSIKHEKLQKHNTRGNDPKNQ
jgi:hypothetical protein